MTFPNSKGFRRLKSRIDYFLRDLEMAEIVAKSGALLHSDPALIFDMINPAEQPMIAVQKNSDASRSILLSHLKTTVYTAFFKEIYEEAIEYAGYALTQAAASGNLTLAKILANFKVKITPAALITLTSRDDIVDYVIGQVVGNLERNRTTAAIFHDICSTLSIGVTDADINPALPYLQIRHLLVHNEGRVTPEFRATKPADIKLKSGKVLLTRPLAVKTGTMVTDLCRKIDDALIAAALMPAAELN